MNNKGQVLVCFVLLIPLIFMLTALIINLGLIGIEKRKIDSSVKDAVNYALNNIEEENLEIRLKSLIKQNTESNNIDIIINNNYVKITVNKEYKGILKYLKKDNIKSSYVGSISDNKKIIKREY